MAVRNPHGPPKQYCFKPGHSGNPGGRPKHFLTRSKVKTMIDNYLSLSRNELEALMIDKDTTPALELMIISTILYCIKAGDYSRLEALLTRAVGKVKEEIEDEGDPNENISRLSMSDLLSLVKPVTPKEPTE